MDVLFQHAERKKIGKGVSMLSRCMLQLTPLLCMLCPLKFPLLQNSITSHNHAFYQRAFWDILNWNQKFNEGKHIPSQIKLYIFDVQLHLQPFHLHKCNCSVLLNRWTWCNWNPRNWVIIFVTVLSQGKAVHTTIGALTQLEEVQCIQWENFLFITVFSC